MSRSCAAARIRVFSSRACQPEKVRPRSLRDEAEAEAAVLDSPTRLDSPAAASTMGAEEAMKAEEAEEVGEAEEAAAARASAPTEDVPSLPPLDKARRSGADAAATRALAVRAAPKAAAGVPPACTHRAPTGTPSVPPACP